eukprot:622497_1
MGICQSVCKKNKLNKQYSKVSLKVMASRDMNCSTIFVDSNIYTTNEDLLNECDRLFITNTGNCSPMSPMENSKVTNDQVQLIHLFILNMQLELSAHYQDTEHTSFAVIPNKIHHLIVSYW